MTREQLAEFKEVINKAEDLIQKIDYLTGKLEVINQQISELNENETLTSKEFLYVLKILLGDNTSLNSDFYNEDSKNILTSAAQILENRIKSLNEELENIPSYLLG